MNDFDPLTTVAQALGLDPLFVAGLVPFIILGSNLIGRAIPDDAAGWQGIVRKIAKVLGLYLSNRVSSGISVNKVVQVAAGVRNIEEVPALAASVVTSAVPPLNIDTESVMNALNEREAASWGEEPAPEIQDRLTPLFPPRDSE